MRTSKTDGMTKILTKEFRRSNQSPREFIESLTECLCCWEDSFKEIQYVCSNVYIEGYLFEVYHTSESPTEIFVKR
jgi:hypothetical protein